MNNKPLSHLYLVLIDNQDSFTYNLVDELRVMGVNLSVFRNTVNTHKVMATLSHYKQQGPTLLMLSPGPGAPSSAGNMPAILEEVKGLYPVLGICLGHQAIVESYQGKVARAPEVMHGKSSMMQHNYPKIFKQRPSPMAVARYHSLAAVDVPECLQVIADIDGLPMAILHQNDKMLGFQFHPESVLTSQGSQLLLQAMHYLVSEPIAHQAPNANLRKGKEK
jgi:anthranilate synthase component 2